MASKDEYLMLRNEILGAYNIVNSTRNTLYVFVAGIISYAFVHNKLALFLIPHIAIIPMYLIAIDYTRDMYRIGTYLQVFLEGDDFNWEIRQYAVNYKINNKMPRFSMLFHIPYILTSLASFFCLTYKVCNGNFCNLLRIIFDISYNPIFSLCFFIAILELGIVGAIFFRFKKMDKIQQEYLNAWNELKHIERIKP